MASPALACGPMTSGGSTTSGTTSTSGGDNTKRRKWVKKRVENLNQRNENYRGLRFSSKLGDLSGPFPTAEDKEADRKFRAIQKQHKREQIELMMLKNELGEISPDERKALADFLKRRRARAQGQNR